MVRFFLPQHFLCMMVFLFYFSRIMWFNSPQFASPHDLGRVALVGTLLGIFCGFHLGLALFCLAGFGNYNMWQWSLYATSLSAFHLLEFFVTAIYNPSVVSSDSFLVNHSKAYSAANLFASTEFFLKVIFFPQYHISVWIWRVGIVLVLISQAARSLAMVTCGESFNHLIQTHKKDNHVLITHGIYKYLRHPSYFGFFYWSIGTQLLLQNCVSFFLFGYASCMFFRRRIPYEEASLIRHFPVEYKNYAQHSRILIPFIPSKILLNDNKKDI